MLINKLVLNMDKNLILKKKKAKHISRSSTFRSSKEN